MLRAAAATEVLNRELKKLGGGVGRDQSLRRMSRDAAAAERDVSNLGRSADRTKNQLDTMSGRVSLVGDALATLGPSLIPLGAVGVAGVAGLAAQFGFAAAGAGVLVGSMQGVGTALKAVNKAAIEPTAANLDAAKLAMKQISPAAQGFVKELQHMEPELKKLRDVGATNMFPGFTEGMKSLESAFPRVQNIVGSIASALGEIGADAGSSLASDRWAPFLDFLAKEAPAALKDMAAIAGNTGHAMAELWMAFTPTNRDFSSFMVKSSQDLDKWATGLSKTQGFQEFIDYIQTNGPQVGATLGAIGNAFLQIIEAAAPLGGPVLHVIETLANAIAGLANSDLGTPIMVGVAAWRAYAVAASLAEKAQLKFNATSAGGFGMTAIKAGGNRATSGTKSYASQVKRDLGVVATTWGTAGARSERESARMAESSKRLTSSLGKPAAGAVLLGVAMTGVADKIGIANTSMLGLTGFMVGGPLGAGVGALAGGFLDLKAAGDGLSNSLTQLTASAGKVDLSTFDHQLSQVQSRINDMKHSHGFGDFITDNLKGASNTLHGMGLTKGAQVSNAQGQINAAQATQDAALREKGAAAANREMAASSVLAAHGFDLTAAGARAAGMSVAQFTATLRGANEALTRQGTLDAYTTALLDARDALKENGATLNRNTREGLANRAMLRGIANGATEYAVKMKDAAKRTEFMDKARSDFIKMAKAMGASGAEARQLANIFGLVDQGAKLAAVQVQQLQTKIKGLKGKIVDAKAKGAKESSPEVQALRAQIKKLEGKVVKIKADPSKAFAGASAAQRAIDNVHGKTVDIKVTRTQVGNGASAGGSLNGTGADGATVPKTGKPYADRHLYLVADGERIVSNRYGQVDANADILNAINNSRGRLAGFADGGTAGSVQRSYATAPGISVTFPSPSVLAQAVQAANDIAAAAIKTTATAKDLRAVHLSDLQAQIQVRDIARELRAKETVKVHGKKVTRLVVRGLDRVEKRAELADARATLVEMRKQNDLQKQLADAKAQAVADLEQSRKDTSASISGGLDLFAGSASTAVKNAGREVADIAQAGQVMAQLRAKGASPSLLQQMRDRVMQGDARAVVKLGQAFLSQPALLGELNAELSTLGSVSSSVAALTTDPRFLGGTAWSPSSPSSAAVTQTKIDLNMMADPSTWTPQIMRAVNHIIDTKFAALTS